MLDVKLLREEPERVKKGIVAKNADPALVDQFLALDEEWRKATQVLDELRAKQNSFSRESDREAAKKNKEAIKEKETQVKALVDKREVVLLKIPNLPSGDTPIGKDENDNKVLRKVGEPTKFSAEGETSSMGGDFEPKDHVAIGEALGLINIESAGKISGSRFAYLMGAAARLEFALVQYTIEVLTNPKIIESIASGVKSGHSAKPFIPVIPPVMIKSEVLQRMARLEPKEDRYYIESDDAYLVGSAEHTLGPLHMDEIIPEEQLPIRYLGFSTAFRREAGSYGKDVRGILRLHQFDKLEMESFTLAENGLVEQDFFVAVQEYLVQALKLPYQVVAVCTGDMGMPDARQIDIEMWIPSEKKYRETHSADYMSDYQARRLGTRVKRKNGETEFVHMNDATAFAIGRTLIAIIENYQTKEGNITIPTVLRSYMGSDMITK